MIRAPRATYIHRPERSKHKGRAVDSRNIRVSVEAWNGLEVLCMRWHAGKTRVGRLCDLLPESPDAYIDRRPRAWKLMDEAMLEQGQFPQWSYEYPRMRHNVVLRDDTIDKLVAVARHYAITMAYHKSHWDMRLARVNALLEAIGTELLMVHTDR